MGLAYYSPKLHPVDEMSSTIKHVTLLCWNDCTRTHVELANNTWFKNKQEIGKRQTEFIPSDDVANTRTENRFGSTRSCLYLSDFQDISRT